jgi:hypothetical protein
VGAACRAAVLIGERDIRLSERGTSHFAHLRNTPATGTSDLLELIELLDRAESEQCQTRALRAMDLDPGTVRSVARGVAQLERLATRRTPTPDGTDALGDRSG